MLSLTELLAAVLLAQTASAVPAVPAPPALTGTCKAVAPCVSTLRAYSARTSFCSSYLDIRPRTSWVTATTTTTTTDTSTTTSTTGTDTVTADTVTVLGHGESIIGHFGTQTATDHITTEWAPTPTETAHVYLTTTTQTSTRVICGNQKRALEETFAPLQERGLTKTPPPLPTPLKVFKSSIISSGCKCLSLTTPTNTITTTTAVTTNTVTVETKNVAATETTTPTITDTYRTTSLPTGTTTVTPTTTLTPPVVTTTPTSTVTTTTTTTIRVGQAAVQLSHPTPITPVSNGRATSSYDDETGWRINNLPFAVGLYGVTSRNLIIGINGWVSPGTTDSGTYQNTHLPNSAAGDPSWVAYWSDLFITQGTSQGIYYEIDGDPGHRVLSIEYFMSFYRNPTAYTHFLINLFEDEVGRVVYTYFQTTSQHAALNSQLGTIGVQRPGTGQANEYSYDRQPREGLSIEWRPSTNAWREITAGSC